MTDFDNYVTYLRELAMISGKHIIIAEQKERKKETMKITLRNGMVVEGTFEQVNRVAMTFGERVPFQDDGFHYDSSSKGVILIREMETQHLRHALLKRYANFVQGLKVLTNDRIAAEISNPSDKTLVGLMAEFSRRKITGKL